MYLRVEDPAWPTHFCGLAIVDGRALWGASGQLRWEEIRDRLDRRLTRVPELRRRVYFPGPLRGGPLWVDDGRFAIEHHVHQKTVEPPGGDAELLEAAAAIYGRSLDRTRPLWELWFLTGLNDGRVGVLLKLHHAVADGAGAVAIMGSLFDLAPDVADPASSPWTPEPIPGGWSLLAENLSTAIRTVGRAAASLAHPGRAAGGMRVLMDVVRRSVGVKGAARTSLNQVVRPGRRIRYLRLDLAAMKEAAHAHGATVNDLVLDLWSGGLRRLLVSRGEPIAGLELTTTEPVSTRSATDSTIDNQVGLMVLRLPVWEADVQRRLDLIARTTRETKAGQRPAAIRGVLVRLSATPIGRYLTLHQRAANVFVTNVIGPPVPMFILGSQILAVLPIVQVAGNIGLSLCAFSYTGEVFLVVTADASGFPDLDVLMTGMERDWGALVGGHVAEPIAESMRAAGVPTVGG
ncbi:MAG TPA: wax ester/triacylglycerol synthase family O-acyltransferase [Actinomycetota bacterium]|nr:wax ester/triacylglycerol synthase family O-acyltransferase [Actinomycetota bacterium]